LLELFERQGLGDAPWPPHYRKQSAEPSRVQPSKRKKHPLIEVGRARRKDTVLAGLERWKARHPQAAAHLEPADVLIDAMRGRYSTWTRIRINLQHVPAELRPAQEPLDPDEKIRSSS
jgi:bifunctional non-homologous end joining protein LigD